MLLPSHRGVSRPGGSGLPVVPGLVRAGDLPAEPGLIRAGQGLGVDSQLLTGPLFSNEGVVRQSMASYRGPAQTLGGLATGLVGVLAGTAGRGRRRVVIGLVTGLFASLYALILAVALVMPGLPGHAVDQVGGPTPTPAGLAAIDPTGSAQTPTDPTASSRLFATGPATATSGATKPVASATPQAKRIATPRPTPKPATPTRRPARRQRPHRRRSSGSR